MSRFITDVQVRILPPGRAEGRKQYLLLKEFEYESDILGRIVAPIGFPTDFASIPRIAWRYIDPEDQVVLYASVVHDFLYSVSGLLPDGRRFTREQADSVLKEAMKLSGARWDQQAAVYRCVRLFGGSHWNSP